LGTPDAHSTTLWARSVLGDDRLTGPLASAGLRVGVFHIGEGLVRSTVGEQIFSSQIAPKLTELDVGAIQRAVAAVRMEFAQDRL
jgi:hypothetical protein